jgi:hypothetical protein
LHSKAYAGGATKKSAIIPTVLGPFADAYQ